MMTVSLPDEMADRVRREADVRGLSPDAVVQLVLNRALPRPFVPTGQLSDVELMERIRREDHTDDPVELARRQVETDELLRALDRHRRETD